MATLYVSEFSTMAWAGSIGAPIAPQPPRVEQTVAIGGTSTQSAAFSAFTKLMRVHTDAICSIAVGRNPTATATTMRLAANQTEYFGVAPGDKIAVITNT